jgi:hypothetical protein
MEYVIRLPSVSSPTMADRFFTSLRYVQNDNNLLVIIGVEGSTSTSTLTLIPFHFSLKTTLSLLAKGCSNFSNLC